MGKMAREIATWHNLGRPESRVTVVAIAQIPRWKVESENEQKMESNGKQH